MRMQTISQTGQSRLRLALYVVLALAWIFIAIAQFTIDAAKASDERGEAASRDSSISAISDAEFVTYKVDTAQFVLPTAAQEAADSAPTLSVNSLTSRMEQPRWFHILPNGDVLVAEDGIDSHGDERQNANEVDADRDSAEVGALRVPQRILAVSIIG